MEPRIDRPSNEISTSQAMAGVHVTVPEAEVAAGTLIFYIYVGFFLTNILRDKYIVHILTPAQEYS